MKFTGPFTLPEHRSRPATDFYDDPGMTEKSHADECNINVIMAKYQQTGQLPQLVMKPLFGDFTETPDYRQAVETIREAEEAFLQIPAKIRLQFGNDPGEFIKFCSDEKNAEQLTKWGLTNPAPTPTIEQQTLEAIKALKPQETKENGDGQK